MESEVLEATDYTKSTPKPAICKKPKLNTPEIGVTEPSSIEVVICDDVKELASIYSHRNEDNVLIKHRPGKRSVTFSEEPVKVGLAAPRTFTRNYIKSNHKKKKDITSEGLYMLMKNPEVLQRLDNADEGAKAVVKPADQSTPDSDLGIKVNSHDQMKIRYFKPPSAGSFAPASSGKEGSDGESVSSGDSSEENVYVVGQSEHDEECLTILSNGLDEDEDENEKFFGNTTPLKETNIDEVIYCAKMTEVIENNSPKKFKETSLIETPPVPIAPESEESEESSLGSVDSGIHEAGTDHDSPVDEVPPALLPKPVPPPKPSVAPKPSPAPKPIPAPKPTVAVAPLPPIPQPEPTTSQAQEPLKPPPSPPAAPAESSGSGESESESEMSETESEDSESGSESSDARPPSPEGHEMTYLQYDEEPMLPKYKRDARVESKKQEPVSVKQVHLSIAPEKVPRAASPSFRQPATETKPIEIPKTSLENFFGPIPRPSVEQSESSSESSVSVDGRPPAPITADKAVEQDKLKQLRQKEIKSQQHLQRQLELKKQQELQLAIERQQLEELQRHRELQRLQEMQRQELMRIQQEERRREDELARKKMEQQEEKKRREFEEQVERERQAEMEKKLRLERQAKEDEERRVQAMLAKEAEKQRQIDLLRQIEVEKQKQLEAQRRHQEQKSARFAQLHSEIDDIDSLLEGLMEMDPLIHQQSQQQKLKQLEAEIWESKQREAAQRKQLEMEQARAAQEEKLRSEEARREAERAAADEEKSRKQAELDAIRERKRKMREMTLDDVLKLQKTKGSSPTPSVKSESVPSVRRSSNESLNSLTASLDKMSNGTLRAPGSNQMIAPISLIHEIINPQTQEVPVDTITSRQLPVIVDNELVESPRPARRSNTTPVSTELDGGAIDFTAIKTKLDATLPLKNPAEYGRPPNSLIEPAIVETKIETLSRAPPELPQPSPPHQPPNVTPLSPNTARIKHQEEQWLDIDDLLADVQSMVQQPAIPPRVTTSTMPRPNYQDIADPSRPPKLPARSPSPTPPLPTRTFSSVSSTPPVSPSRPLPQLPPPAPYASPPALPPRTTTLYEPSGSSGSYEGSTSAGYPRPGFNNSSMRNPNPHESTLKKKSSIEELNKRTEELGLHRNTSYSSSTRSSLQGGVYPLSPQPQGSTSPTNVTVPFYQPQKMYQRSPHHSMENSPAPQEEGPLYASIPAQYNTGPPLSPPPRNSPPPPPLPRRQTPVDRIQNSRHHTLV